MSAQDVLDDPISSLISMRDNGDSLGVANILIEEANKLIRQNSFIPASEYLKEAITSLEGFPEDSVHTKLYVALGFFTVKHKLIPRQKRPIIEGFEENFDSIYLIWMS